MASPDTQAQNARTVKAAIDLTAIRHSHVNDLQLKFGVRPELAGCVHRTMNTLNSRGPDEPKVSSWLRHVGLGLLWLVALVSLVLSFAVEFMATGVDFHRHAQSLLDSNDVPSALGAYANDDLPSRLAH